MPQIPENEQQRPIGASILALLALLVALLYGLLAFSYWLRGAWWPEFEYSRTMLLGLLVAGIGYGVQAWAVAFLRRGTRAFTAVLVLLVSFSGLWDASRNEVLALGNALVLMLAFLTSLATLLYLHPEAMRRR